MRKSAVILIFVVVSAVLAASGQDLEHALRKKYEHHVLLLRHPTDKNSQQFDLNTLPAQTALEVPWTIYAPVEITRVNLAPDQLRLTGQRLIFVYDQSKKQLVPMRSKDAESVRVDISLSSPLTNPNDADALIARVLTANAGEIVDSLPPYWQRYLKHQAEPATSTALPAGVFHVGDGVNAPKPIYTPEPVFTDAARHIGFEATCVLAAVIDREGRVQDPYIVRPAGAGLDEQAIAAMKTWKFKPATRNGEPVSVLMGLEVTFSLR